MKSSRTALRTLTLALVTAGALGLAAAEGVRPEVGKPLQQASDLLRAGKAREALAKVRDADAVAGKTAAEQMTIDRMKAAAAQRAADWPTAVEALESLYARAGATEQGQLAEQLASAYTQQRNNARATEWLNKALQAGNSSATVKQLQAYLQSASGDYAAIARDAAAAVATAEQAGRRPDESELLRLADAQQRTGNSAGYVATLEKLLLNYPRKDYWSAYLGRLPRKPGFGDRYALDVLRLRLASGTLAKTDDYMEMAQLALQAGLPAEARRIVEQGFKSGALGTGAEAARHQRLRELALRQEAELKADLARQANEADGLKEGDALVRVGYAYVSFGEADKGIALIEKGIAKGQLRRPDESRLRLGMAQLQSSKSRAAAAQTLHGVRGSDGAAEVARLWSLLGSP